MSPLGAHSRPDRMGFLLLLLTIVVAGLEVWAIGASIRYLLR